MLETGFNYDIINRLLPEFEVKLALFGMITSSYDSSSLLSDGIGWSYNLFLLYTAGALLRLRSRKPFAPSRVPALGVTKKMSIATQCKMS